MKNIIKILGLTTIMLVFYTFSAFPNSYLKESRIYQDQPDSLKLLTQYSLFSEYYKNKDYISALPYGWNVIKMNPEKFSKYLYYKMEDSFWKLHDSTGIPEDTKKSIEDTIVYFYNLAIKYYPPDKSYWTAKKAYIEETWLNMPPDSTIPLYALAIKEDSTLSSFYYDRLGQLYIDNATDQNDYKDKAIELYSYLANKEPNNSTWNERLTSLVKNIDELVELTKKLWLGDKENLAKAWKYATTAVQAGNYKQAVVPLEFLTKKSPDAVNYWVQLANAYQRSDELNKAVDAYKETIKLQPDNKDNYLNLGIVYKDKGDYSKAREQYIKASEVGKNWGLPIYYEGLLYEEAARKCTFDFKTKLVYLLAVETYRRAFKMDPTVTQAEERVKALSDSLPTKEDYFFRNIKEGTVLPITGECFGWINRSVTVPSL